MNLNFGCGSIQPNDWVNVDIDPEFNTEIKNIHLIDDNQFDKIVAHCSIQMIEYNDLERNFNGLCRILKPGGVLRISLPNITKGFEMYMSKNIDWFPNGEDDLHDRFCAWLTWYSTSKSLLTFEALKSKLLLSGFEDVSLVDFKISFYGDEKILELDTRQYECYFTEAVK